MQYDIPLEMMSRKYKITLVFEKDKYTNILRYPMYCHFFIFLVLAYKKKIGFTGTLLIEPKPKEPSKHQYDYG